MKPLKMRWYGAFIGGRVLTRSERGCDTSDRWASAADWPPSDQATESDEKDTRTAGTALARLRHSDADRAGTASFGGAVAAGAGVCSRHLLLPWLSGTSPGGPGDRFRQLAGLQRPAAPLRQQSPASGFDRNCADPYLPRRAGGARHQLHDQGSRRLVHLGGGGKPHRLTAA